MNNKNTFTYILIQFISTLIISCKNEDSKNLLYCGEEVKDRKGKIVLR